MYRLINSNSIFLCFFLGEIKELPSVLYVPVVYPCMEKERLCITVDLLKGTFLASLGDQGMCNIEYILIFWSREMAWFLHINFILFPENEFTDDVEKCLNADHRDLKKLLTYLRLVVLIEKPIV